MKRREDESWLALIQQQIDSKLSISAFCTELGLCRSQFHKKKRLLLDLSHRKPDTAFVKVERPIQSTLSPTIQITHQQCRIELPLSITPDWLANLVKALS